MLFKLPVALLAVVVDGAWAKAVPAEPTITAPAILPRQVAADWIGWVKDPERGTCRWTVDSMFGIMLTVDRDFAELRYWRHVVSEWYGSIFLLDLKFQFLTVD